MRIETKLLRVLIIQSSCRVFSISRINSNIRSKIHVRKRKFTINSTRTSKLMQLLHLLRNSQLSYITKSFDNVNYIMNWKEFDDAKIIEIRSLRIELWRFERLYAFNFATLSISRAQFNCHVFNFAFELFLQHDFKTFHFNDIWKLWHRVFKRKNNNKNKSMTHWATW